MRCVECGHEIKDGAIFCIRCGAMQVASGNQAAGQAPTVNRATSGAGGAGGGRSFTPTPKRGGSGVVVFVIAAIAVLAAIVALAMFVLNPSSSGGSSSSEESQESSVAASSESSSSSSSSSSASSSSSSASSSSASKSSSSASSASASASSASAAAANGTAQAAGQQGAAATQAAGGQATGGTDGSYMLSDSSTRYYSEAELSNMSSGDLYIARNEIFARHGRMFNDSYLQNYFNSKSWYKPIYTPAQWDATMGNALSAVETTNAARMLNVENSRNASTQSSSNTYVLSDSSSRTYSKSELSSLSAYDLYIARNEIYARHGRGFDNADLQKYFNGKSWYTRKYSPSQFDASVLSSTEQTNLKRIVEVEKERNSPYAG